MSQNKLVSVTINAYNCEKYIADTLTSVINQSYKNLQIIVIDDASTDNTAEIIKGFDDPRIELYSLEKNGHISNAINEGYRKVKGEYMVHIDSDDIMAPDLVEKTIDFLENNSEYGAVFHRPTIIDQNSNDVRDEFLENVFNTTAKTQADFVRLFFESSNHLLHPGSTMRKSVMDDIGFHDMSLCYLHDFDYWTRLVLKYPIYVFTQPLIKYRMDTSGSHNSDLSIQKTLAHNTEYSRIIYKMIDNCPDSLFCEAFADKFKLDGEHTHEEIEIEKAFLLQDGLMVLPQNKILSILKFSRLFKEKSYVELARDKFGFSIRDFYKLQSSEVLYDKAQIDALDDHALYLEQTNAALTKHAEKLQQDREYFENLVAHKQLEIDNLNAAVAHKQRLLNKTVEYNVARLIKKAITVLKHCYHFLILRDKNGKKYRKSVMLYGFYGMNLGDDLFFEKLLKRYPNTMFLVYCFGYYRPFFEQFDNVKFYAYDDPLVAKVKRLGDKFKITDLFELLLLKRSSATVHIGGSIYQQIGDYELDYKLRRRRKQRGKPFYSISCNFGAYSTEEFKQKWGKQFKNFKDVCFRDNYSYELFSSLKSVRRAPDLLFSYKSEMQETQPDSVAISVFNPFALHRSHSEEVCNAYLDTLSKTVADLVSDGKKVTLLSFCSFEGDREFVEKLLGTLPWRTTQKVEVIDYTFDTKDAIINALASAEYIIGTRLHSVILGLVMGKKVLPIAYNQKIHYILGDIGYNQPIIELDDISVYSKTGLCGLLDKLKPFDVSEYTNSDDLQFAKLDKFLR